MISYIKGYYVITVEGVGTERFLNHLMRNNVNVYNVTRISNTKIQFCVDRSDMSDFKKAYRVGSFQSMVYQKGVLYHQFEDFYALFGNSISALL